jgi:hypothetical protein
MLRDWKIYPLVLMFALLGLAVYAATDSSSLDAITRRFSGAGAPTPQPSLPVSGPVTLVGLTQTGVLSPLGATVMDVGPAEAKLLGLSYPSRGVIVDCVVGGCAASQAGLRPDDIIVSVNDQPVFNRVQFWSLLRNQPTSSLNLDVLRCGREKRIVVDPRLGPMGSSPNVALAAGTPPNPCAVCPL